MGSLAHLVFGEAEKLRDQAVASTRLDSWADVLSEIPEELREHCRQCCQHMVLASLAIWDNRVTDRLKAPKAPLHVDS